MQTTPEQQTNKTNTIQALIYQIKIQGALPQEWAEWFDGLQMETDAAGNTFLTGPVSDQAALHGLLARVRDLGLVLLSLQRLDRTKA